MLLDFIKSIYRQRRLIWALAKRDYRQQNQGSLLGVAWNYLQPILFVTVLYSVFTFGFRSGVEMEVSFGLYLISGMVCWLYFADNLAASPNIVRAFEFLVKKVDFRLSILPFVKFSSSLLPHVILTMLVVLIAASLGHAPTLHLFQIIYYYFCMLCLLSGLSWLTSSTSIFVKDVANIVNVSVQFGFWLTPIIWKIESMPERLQFFLKLNPAYYLVTGYREAILSQGWFWNRPYETLMFWGTTVIIVISGVVVFRKLKPHFSEVM